MKALEKISEINDFIISEPILFHSLTVKERLTLITTLTNPNLLSDWDVQNLEKILSKVDRYIQTRELPSDDAFEHINRMEDLKNRRAISRYSKKNNLFIALLVHRYWKVFDEFPRSILEKSIIMKTKIRFPDLTSIPLTEATISFLPDSLDPKFSL